MDKIKNYLKTFFGGIGWLVGLLFAALIMTAFVANYEYGILGKIYPSTLILVFVIIMAVIFIALGALYMYLELPSKKITFADSIAFAIAVCAIIFTFALAIALGGFNYRRIIAVVLMFIVGIGYIVLRAFNFGKETEYESNYTNKSIKGYYLKIIDKFSFPALFMAAIVLVCMAYLILSGSFARIYLGTNRAVTLCLSFLLIIPFILYGIKSTLSKKVNAFDGILLAAAFAIFITLIQLIIKDFSTLKMIGWALITLGYIAVLFIRFKLFDLSIENEPVTPVTSKHYDKALASKYSIIDILAISGTLALSALVLLKSGVMVDGLGLKFIPAFVILVTALVVIGFVAFAALLNVTRKSIGFGDFCLAICIAFAACGFVAFAIYPSRILLYLLLAFSVYDAILLAIRTHIIAKN